MPSKQPGNRLLVKELWDARYPKGEFIDATMPERCNKGGKMSAVIVSAKGTCQMLLLAFNIENLDVELKYLPPVAWDPYNSICLNSSILFLRGFFLLQKSLLLFLSGKSVFFAFMVYPCGVVLIN